MIEDYIKNSGEALLSACFVYDNARSAEKMLDWKFLGKDNLAWTEGPCLSAPANAEQINHEYPYILNMSKEFSVAANLVIGNTPIKNANGGVTAPMSPPRNKDGSRVESVIAKLAIIEQFEIYKEFLITFEGPYNKKRLQAWQHLISEDHSKIISTLTNRRNELTHDKNCLLPTMKEAVEYYYLIKQSAKILYNTHVEHF
ncbi:hypothetical protein GCM10023211_21540 [Orbus sasakiae]|uniref:RiboL-PSP-HEPN domain-containing protein n=1 Tax=Orbus sasakiae TaxID=1078475 RepID=A0ABP9NAT0_9GAMM